MHVLLTESRGLFQKSNVLAKKIRFLNIIQNHTPQRLECYANSVLINAANTTIAAFVPKRGPWEHETSHDELFDL